MVRTVRIPRRVMNERRISQHHESYRRVMAADGNTYVWGHGSYTPDVVVIRHRPTKDEEVAGHLMEGKPGNLFWKHADKNGFPVNRVWVTSMWKFHKDYAHRQTTPEYMSAVRVFLEWELKILKPKLVVAVAPFAWRGADLMISPPEEAMLVQSVRASFTRSMADVGRRLNSKE